MNRYVPDTHALHWYLSNSGLLSKAATATFGEGERGEATFFVPTVVLAEMYFILRKGGEGEKFAAVVARLNAAKQFEFVTIEVPDVMLLDSMPGDLEMHDRLIAIAAKRLGAVLVTRDRRIVASGVVPTLW